MTTGAVILAAGHKSSTTSFQPMLPVGDTTAVKRIIITLQRAGVEPVVVITGDRGEELEKHISKMRVVCLKMCIRDRVHQFFHVKILLHFSSPSIRTLFFKCGLPWKQHAKIAIPEG